MTSVVRYVQNTTTAANVNTAVGSTGGDYQLISFDIVTTAAIAAGANANVLTWTGAGKIKSISNYTTRGANGLYRTIGFDTVTIDATGKIINVAVAGGAGNILAGSTLTFLLVIGNY